MNAADAIEPPQSFYSAPVRGASAAAMPYWEQFLAPNIAWLHLRTEKRRLDRLATLGENWDGRGSAAPNRTIIDQVAEEFLPELYQEVAVSNSRWTAPHITASEAGEIVLEWWRGERKLTMYVGEDRIEYLKVWGLDMDNEMEHGELLSTQDFRSIWTWLHS